MTICAPRSKRSEQQNRSALIKQWLVRFALNAGQALDADGLSAYASLWLEAFDDLSADVLEAAFKRTINTCKFWPVKIADIREHIERAEDSRAEDEWHALLEYSERFVYPDAPMRGPRLPADIDHAARAAGGLRELQRCPTVDLVWAKKRFIEDLTRQRKTGDIAGFLPGSELRGLLEAFTPRFILPAIPENTPARREDHGESVPRPLLRKAERAAAAAAVIREGKELLEKKAKAQSVGTVTRSSR